MLPPLLAPRRWPRFVALAICFCLLKLVYQRATPADLRGLLTPTNALVELATGTTAVFEFARGYHNPALRIVIDKSCSGFTFWLISATLLTGVVLARPGRVRGRSLLAAPLFAYGLALLANTARILTAVQLRATLPPPLRDYGWLHQAEGSLVYLLFLLGGYVAFTALRRQTLTRYA